MGHGLVAFLTACLLIMAMDRTFTTVSFGETLWDIIGERSHLGGAAFNLAAHAARLGNRSHLISCVGDDELGTRARAEAALLGIDVSGIQTEPTYPTGTVTVVLTNGQPEYTIHERVAWDHIAQPASSSIPSADMICFGTLAQRSPISRQSLHTLVDQNPDVPKFYDVNLRQEYYSRDRIIWGFEHATIVKVNESESHLIATLLFDRNLSLEEFAREVQETYGVQIVLTTLGENGCLVADNGTVAQVRGERIKIADAIGAGDAFSAAFLTAWLRGHSAKVAAELGNQLGAFVATQNGAVPVYSPEIRQKLSDVLNHVP